jgi:hypothetical protein
MTDNLSRFTALDNAYNSRDWDAYSALLDDSFRGWMQGRAHAEGKAEHLRNAKEFCALSADNRVHNSPYVVALSDREWTCTIASFTGSMTGPLKTGEGKTVQPSHRTFETTFATIARWVGGKIVEEYEFLDSSAILAQVVGADAK